MWLSFESADKQGRFKSFLVAAKPDLDTNRPSITLLTDSLTRIDSQTGIHNIGDEALLLDHQRVLSFHELNGPEHVGQPNVHWLIPADRSTGLLPFVGLPYRLTDVTALDDTKRFWAINYRYQNDKFLLAQEDPIAQRFGLGPTHRLEANVERLIEFKITDQGIVFTDTPPIQLQLTHEQGRNWEGIARLDDLGLLLVTDEYPQTYFGFVPFPDAVQKTVADQPPQ